jgi:hypothetical protein
MPLIIDFASGFIIPGPPPATYLGYLGTLSRNFLDNTIGLNSLINDTFDYAGQLSSSIWEAYYKRHINPNWENDPLDPYCPQKGKSEQLSWESDSPCK